VRNDDQNSLKQESTCFTDSDPIETAEWMESLESVVEYAGAERGRYLLDRLEQMACQYGFDKPMILNSPYVNTIHVSREENYPGNLEIEERITAIVRWNALAMVARANSAYGELGGHIASFASAAEIFEVGFTHFFRGPDAEQGGDLVFFQPHSAPGIYARAWLEGRLTDEHLSNFRREVRGQGLSAYPHPWLMPNFWQFPTGSMGLGPISAIYQARFMRYLEHRGLAQTGKRRVWGVFGDGEMDEPESIAALTLAARENLDNLCFVINCNLQRLDGPVRGNGHIIQELESLFMGAGWNVIKVLWGSEWDSLFAQDTSGLLLRQLSETVDGEYQTLGANSGAFNQEHFFERDPRLRAQTAHMSSDKISALRRGGHDPRKLYAAFAAASNHRGKPTVILAKTKKGYGMGRAGESRNTSHQKKTLDQDALRAFRDRFSLAINDEELREMRFYKPPAGGLEMQYLQARRAALGGFLPTRRISKSPVGGVPDIEHYADFALKAEGKEMSTTMALLRMLTALLRDKGLGPRIVPIVADEGRTFGMASLFRQIGIYSPGGQKYVPEDEGSLTSYREARDGQMLEEGITEAGALSSWVAAATAYSVHELPLLAVYVFYSMFGFQRVGDLIWAAADQRARGFLIGATAGRTTLSGEGLQHQDGASQLFASTIPSCRAYDPTFAGELAIILDHGVRAILAGELDEFYYITVTNESYPQLSIPAGAETGVLRGMYCLSDSNIVGAPRVRLLGSGAILREAIEAAKLLAADWHVGAEVWSVTSFTELSREARLTERWNRLHPTVESRASYVASCLPGGDPVVAATDYVSAYAQLIAAYITAPFVSLGTDGFGRSDTRPLLRRFFEVDRQHIVVAALFELSKLGAVGTETVASAIDRYAIVSDAPAPWTV
jgi:pyruvate dehydrogenase E1 component